MVKREPIDAAEQHIPQIPIRAGSQPISITSDTHIPAESIDSTSTVMVGDSNSGGAGCSTSSGTLATDREMQERIPRDAIRALGNDSRVLIQAIQKMEALNIDTTLPSLPKIVVVGDQSAGKSSVIEATCDITLPRSGGTCTRCPFLITTTTASDGQPWNCRVSLHLKYDYMPGKRGGENGFDHWSEEKNLESIEFCRVWDKKDLEVTLRRAQLAILNPQKHHQQFVKIPIGPEQEYAAQQVIGFSPNAISLEITGDNLPELSLYDLPGAINSLGREDEQYLVHFVEKLIKTYMYDEKALILLACPANQDMEVSTAYRFLLDCRAMQRCMGVLTKPDLIELTSAKIDNIRDTLRGSRFPVGHGWFVTRQLSQSELDQKIGYEDARHREQAFFTQQPWNTLLADYAERYGIPSLQGALSQKLTSEILKALPEIVHRVQSRLTLVCTRLSGFPAPALAPSLSVVMEVDRVKSALFAELDAEATDAPEKFRNKYRAAFGDYGKRLRECRPLAILSTPGYVKPSISLDTDDEMEETPSKSRKTLSGRAISATPSRPTPSSSRLTNSTGKGRRTAQQSPEGPDAADRAVFRLDEVKSRIDAASGADLGGQTDLKVMKKAILETVCGWSNITDALLKQIQILFDTMLDNTLARVLDKFRGTELFAQVSHILHTLFTDLMKDMTDVAHRMVACEAHRPITYNKKVLVEKEGQQEAALRERRLKQRVREYFETQEGSGYSVPKPTEWDKKAADAQFVSTHLGPDLYDRELSALALPLAYYDISSVQLVDGMAKQFEYGLMYDYESRLHHKLLEGLRTTDADYCAGLLAADPRRERKRADLLAEKKRLEKALGELEVLPGNNA